jgi:hypothetical protein
MYRRLLFALSIGVALTASSMFGGSGVASAHERCAVTDGVVQVIANGQTEGDPAGYSTNPQGRDRGIRNARDHSPAIVSCPS